MGLALPNWHLAGSAPLILNFFAGTWRERARLSGSEDPPNYVDPVDGGSNAETRSAWRKIDYVTSIRSSITSQHHLH